MTLSGQALLLPGFPETGAVDSTPARPPGTLHPAAGSVRAAGASPALRSRGNRPTLSRGFGPQGSEGSGRGLRLGVGRLNLPREPPREPACGRAASERVRPGSRCSAPPPALRPARSRTPSARPSASSRLHLLATGGRKREAAPGSPDCSSPHVRLRPPRWSVGAVSKLSHPPCSSS